MNIYLAKPKCQVVGLARVPKQETLGRPWHAKHWFHWNPRLTIIALAIVYDEHSSVVMMVIRSKISTIEGSGSIWVDNNS